MFDQCVSSPPTCLIDDVVLPPINEALSQLDQVYQAGQITLATLLIEHLYRRLDHAPA